MEIKCDCGAPMIYDLTLRLMRCEYCGSTKSAGADMEKRIPSPVAQTDEAVCRSCGAVLMSQKNQMSGTCPYCDNVLVLTERKSAIKPDGVIPFMVNESGVVAALRTPITNNALIPKAFKSVNRPEDLQELFVSVWLFELDTKAEFAGIYGDGKKLHKKRESHGHFEKYYDTVAVFATRDHGLNNSAISKVYRFSECKDFEPDYLAGHPAELPSISAGEAFEMAKQIVYQEMKDDIENRMRAHYNAVEADITSLELQVVEETHKCILVPLWCKENVFEDKYYPTVVSGQTGDYFGSYPSSWANFGRGMADIFKRNK